MEIETQEQEFTRQAMALIDRARRHLRGGNLRLAANVAWLLERKIRMRHEWLEGLKGRDAKDIERAPKS